MQCRILAYSFFLLTWVSLPAKDLGIQVHAILETHCAECHGRNSSKPPKPILDKTTDLFRLRADADYVVAGKAGESDLMYRVTTDHKEDRMPPGKKSAPRPKLSGAEVSILGNWINGGGEPAREYISEKQVLETVLEDIRKIPQKERSDLRYLTLHNLHNLPPDIEPAANLDIYRAGVAKLLNSLSWEKELAVPEPVGKSGAVLRIRLSKYGWNDDMWEYVAAHNPYGQVYAGLEGSIEKESGVEGQLVLRMDWFTFACAQPPVYEQLLFGNIDSFILDSRNPELELEEFLEVDVAANLQRAIFGSD